MTVVLVTGGSSGIGLATVRRLAAAGHTVYSASRNPARNGVPDGVTPIAFDVTDAKAAEDVVARIVDDAGRVDALVNNAGDGAIGAFEDMSDADAHRIFEVNLFGPMRLAKAVVPHMRAQGSGRIVNVTSMNDTVPAPFGGWYSASKAALASASKVLDSEVSQFGISVTVVAPGFFRTEMAESLGDIGAPTGSHYADVLEKLRAGNAARLDGAGDPDQVAAAIEGVITATTAPARVVVGADAEAMVQLVNSVDDDAFAQLLRDFVAQMGASE